jgi:glutathione S-transferase
LTLKGRRDEVDFRVIDITRQRPDWLLNKTGGTTALPVLETADGHIIKESLVILQYTEDIHPERPVARRDPCRRAASGSQRVVHGLRASLACLTNRYEHSATDAKLRV